MSGAAIIHGLPWEDYIKGGFLGSSALDAFPTLSREAWSAKYQEGGGYKDDSDSKAITLGSALDLLVTGDPEDWDARYVERPAGTDLRTKDGKAWAASVAGKTILTSEEVAQLKSAHKRAKASIRISESVIHHGTAIYQTTFRGTIEGVSVQTRPDIWYGPRDAAAALEDLKYVNSTNFDGFARQFVGGRYFLQAGLFSRLYREATGEKTKISFLLVESGTTSPRTNSITIPSDVVAAAEEAVASMCRRIAERREEQGGFVDRPEYSVLDLPGWARAQIGLA